jgi:hypothetical protein
MPFDQVGAADSSDSTDLVSKTLARLLPLDKPVVLSVEGNIGAGKSTFLRLLNKHFGEDAIEVMQEPVHRWTDCRGQNMLDVCGVGHCRCVAILYLCTDCFIALLACSLAV